LLPQLNESDTFDNSLMIWAGILLVLLIKVIASVFAFPICAILVMQSSSSREYLGTINGANQALASLGRAIGPAIAGSIYSKSLEDGKPWVVWRYGLGMVALSVWIAAWFLRDEVRLPNPNNCDMPMNDLEHAHKEEEEADLDVDHPHLSRSQ
jgi:MFS family permease